MTDKRPSKGSLEYRIFCLQQHVTLASIAIQAHVDRFPTIEGEEYRDAAQFALGDAGREVEELRDEIEAINWKAA